MEKFWKRAYDETAFDCFADTVLSLASVGPAFAMKGECSHDMATMIVKCNQYRSMFLEQEQINSFAAIRRMTQRRSLPKSEA